jgi:hypothetical protein
MREGACFFLAVFRVFAILSSFASKVELECGSIAEIRDIYIYDDISATLRT